jgi:hypothetical protein
VISKWLDHATASFTMATDVHSQDYALTAAGETSECVHKVRVKFR